MTMQHTQTVDKRQLKTIQQDRMRYTKNKLSANLTLAAILFDVFYFVSLYRSDVGSYYYNWLIGVSIIYNLIFLLASFLCSEGVKSRKGDFWPMLIALGAGQVVRMFILPARAHKATVVINKVESLVMGDGQYIFMLLCLALSALCLLGAAVTSWKQNKELRNYLSTLSNNK